ncbi:MAG: thiamine pyrophosphate-dependent enzyme [Acetobacteraceae bacterium]
MTAAPMTTGEAVVAALIGHGIDTLYALPGVHNDPLFDACARTPERIRVLHPRHEQASAYMALGAALATGRAQVCAAVPGPGILNTAAALLCAWGMDAPVLALAGQIPSFAIDRGLGYLHELPDQLGLLHHLTKFAARIRAPGEAPGLIAAALGAAATPRRRPVALECGIDVWGARAPVVPVAPLPPAPVVIDAAAIERAAALIAKAERPMIVVGGGALDAADGVRALAERLAAPVMSFRRGRGILPTAHPLAVSVTEGHRLWQTADLVIGIGTRMLRPLADWGTDAGLRVIRIDADPEEPGRQHAPDVALVGDAAPVLAALLAALPTPPRPARAGELAALRAWFAERLASLAPQLGFLRAIRAALPADGILVEDVTQLAFVARLAWEVDAPRRYISPGYQDALGWGYGTALGAQAALPGRAVVAVLGDGGFLYQAAELATAMRHRLPVVAVVMDDGAFGNVRRIQQQAFGNRLIACDLTNPDFVAFAESFGARGWRADTPAALEQALRAALASGGPAVIHVRVGELPSPWGMIGLPRVRGPAGRPAFP